MTRTGRLLGWLACLGCLGFGACGPPPPPPDILPRSGRFGSLRDLVLFERSAAEGGPFFLDLFEATGRDWAEFAAATGRGPLPVLRAEPEAPELPVTGLDLRQARALAAWRFCRVPRRDEWWFASTGGGRLSFPWGDAAIARANTIELGLLELAPVGTFESGRRTDGPYDLVGNAAEWTESVPLGWFRDPLSFPDADHARGLVLRLPALREWAPPFAVLPGAWLIQPISPRVPREVVGGDCWTPLTSLVRRQLPGDRGSTLGVRFAADPDGLCTAWAACDEPPSELDQALLLRLLRRPGHAALLAPAWRRAKERQPAGFLPGPLWPLLDRELGP